MNRSLLLSAAVGVTVLLAGCSGTTGAASSAASAASRASSVVAGTAKPAQDQGEGARKDLQDMKCAVDAAGEQWSFSGKLTNSSDKDSDYTIKLSITKKSGGTVIASKDIQQKLAKGASQDVRADNFAKTTGKADDLQCVVGVTAKRG